MNQPYRNLIFSGDRESSLAARAAGRSLDDILGERLDEQIAYREWNGSGWDNYFVHNGGQDSVTRMVDDEGTVVEASP